MKKNNAAFTLVEMLIALSVTSIVMVGTYLLILNNQKQQVREDSVRNLISDSRNVQSFLNSDFRSAGAILTLFHTNNFVGGEIPFNGIQPLDNVGYPDGVILAAGDPNGVTRLTASLTAGSSTLAVAKTEDINGQPLWFAGDVGLVMNANGYYVFSVTAVTNTSLSIAATPVYYSGQLTSTHYNDFLDEQYGVSGNNNTYDIDSPVVRLEYFRIYLVRTETDGSYSLTLTTNTEGTVDIEDSETDTMNVPILENLVDLQMEYVTQDLIPTFWASIRLGGTNESDPCSDPTDAKCQDFRRTFTSRLLSNVRIYMMARSSLDSSRKAGGANDTYDIPIMGDEPARPDIPRKSFQYQYYEYDIALRNYRIVY